MMRHPEQASCKKDRDCINNSRNTGMDCARPIGTRDHLISDHGPWRKTIWAVA
jgi:hypothetical protein